MAHAYEHTPYYRETLDRLGLAPASFGSASDLARLPILEREHVQRDPEYFISTARPLADYVEFRTGGSSGRPLSVFYDPFALYQGAAHHRRSLQVVRQVVGRSVKPLRAAVIRGPGGATGLSERETGPRSPLPAALRPPALRLSLMDTPAHNVERLRAFRPEILGSYGSYLEALFTHVHETGAAFHKPKLVIYGGDAMSDAVRRLIAGEMGVPVLTVYGAVEAPHIGFECERHSGIHLNQDLYPLRLVDGDGRDCAAGQSGQVVLSNLVNRGTILLNYRLGDEATMLDTSCPCGRSLPLLTGVEGRVDDWLETPSGERRHPQTVRTLFTDEVDVWSYRIVQRAPSDLLVQIVASGACDRGELTSRLSEKFAVRLGETIRTEFEFVDSLPRTARGKVKTVVAAS